MKGHKKMVFPSFQFPSIFDPCEKWKYTFMFLGLHLGMGSAYKMTSAMRGLGNRATGQLLKLCANHCEYEFGKFNCCKCENQVFDI